VTNIVEQAIRVCIDYAATDIRVAGAIVAAGLVLGALGILWTKWKDRKNEQSNNP